MSKQFLAVIAVIILAFVGLFLLTNHKANAPSSSGSAKPTSHIEGKGSTGVTLVEYGDYECPFCGQYYPTLKQVESQYADKIYFQFRNFPLVSVHQNAFASARAAEAAALQNKFWEMHDVLYENQNAWSTSSNPSQYFDQYASQLGLNLQQFRNDYASSQVNDIINADLNEGNKLNVQGTPTFFLDGKQVQIANTPADFAKILDAEIAKKTSGAAAPATPASSGTTAQTKQ